MKTKKIINSLCFVTALSLAISLFPAKLYAESFIQEKIVAEESGFDENAHGEVVEEGNCGSYVKYKIYKDETLYIYSDGVYSDGETIGSKIFSSKNISNAYIEDGIVSIGDSLFYECKDLKSIRIPNELKSIGNYAFADCESLDNIEIPNSVEQIMKSGCKATCTVTVK